MIVIVKSSDWISLRKKKGLLQMKQAFVFNPGNDLVSHAVARAVPSALRGLTSVFGMGTGVTLSVRSPENRKNEK
jgi:hypothetical protein